MNSNYIDMYEQTSSRSPGAHRLQPPQIHRQGSRQFDGYGNLPPSYSQSNTYTPSESSQVSYLPEPNRFDGMGNGMGNGLSNGIHNGGFAYDGAQSWNPNAFSPANGMPFAATTRAKSNNRGRSQLPQVCRGFLSLFFFLSFFCVCVWHRYIMLTFSRVGCPQRTKRLK